MDNENTQRKFESVYSSKVRAGRRRTYFFDVRKTKGDDFYITLTESTKKFNGDGYERHKIFLYKEDFNRFLNSLGETIDYVKTELMPEYDYEEFDVKQKEWEESRRQEESANQNPDTSTEEPEVETEEVKQEAPVAQAEETQSAENESADSVEQEESDESTFSETTQESSDMSLDEEDMSW